MATGALGKLRTVCAAPALPRTAVVAVQVSAVHWAFTLIVTLLVRVFAQMLAARWYKKAADQGDRNGQLDYAYMLETGKGVAQDYESAVAWYRKSAEQGEPMAQANLGTMLWRGRGAQT